jgi:hypothetical protein
MFAFFSENQFFAPADRDIGRSEQKVKVPTKLKRGDYCKLQSNVREEKPLTERC